MPVPVKIVLGVMALWGTVYAFAALAGDFAVVTPERDGHVTPSGMEVFVIYVHAFVALAALLIEAGIALSLKRMPVSRRVAWVFAMMFFYPVAIPAFWYLHIWRDPPARESSESAGPSR
jgi:ABC-type sugar transport system permease subunit